MIEDWVENTKVVRFSTQILTRWIVSMLPMIARRMFFCDAIHISKRMLPSRVSLARNQILLVVDPISIAFE